MQKTGYIALSVGPDGMSGIRASYGRKKTVVIEDWAVRKWAGVSGRDLSRKTLEIRDFLGELAGGETRGLRGMFSIHPSWALVRKTPVPSAGKKETHQYLQLQVERQRSLLRNGEIFWDSVEAPADPAAPGREALLFLCRQETTAPIEEAFRACGLPVLFGTVSSLNDFAVLQAYPAFSDRETAVIVRIERSGASLLEIRDRKVAGFSWISFGAEAQDLQARFSLSALRFAELLETCRTAPIILWGDAELRALARKHLIGEREIEEFDPEKLPPTFSLSLRRRPSEAERFPLEVGGLLLCRLGAGAPNINLISSGPPLPIWTGRLGLLLEKKVAIPLAAALFLLLLLTKTGTARLESRMYAETIGSSSKIAAEVSVARRNLAVLERYSKERRPILDILLEITKALPDNVLISDLKITGRDEVRITGNCQSLSVAEQIVANLNKSPLLMRASTERMSKGREGMIFTIKCSLRKRGGGG